MIDKRRARVELGRLFAAAAAGCHRAIVVNGKAGLAAAARGRLVAALRHARRLGDAREQLRGAARLHRLGGDLRERELRWLSRRRRLLFVAAETAGSARIERG